MVAVRKHSTWQEDILLLNHSREIKRAGSVLTLPARAISTKNKHLLVIYSIPTRGFTAAVSVFRGTPPPKPLECKIWLNTIWRASLRRDGQNPPVENLGSPAPVLVLCRLTSSRCRLRFVHRSFTFRSYSSLSVIQGKQKTLLTFAVSRVWKNSMVLLLPAYLRVIQIRFGGLPLIRPG